MGPKGLQRQISSLTRLLEKAEDKTRGLEAKVAELTEQLTNQNLGYVIAKRELEQLKEWTQLTKPHVLSLLAATNKHNELVSVAQTQVAIQLPLLKRSSFEGRRSPHVKARSSHIPVPKRDGTLSRKRKKQIKV